MKRVEVTPIGGVSLPESTLWVALDGLAYAILSGKEDGHHVLVLGWAGGGEHEVWVSPEDAQRIREALRGDAS